MKSRLGTRWPGCMSPATEEASGTMILHPNRRLADGAKIYLATMPESPCRCPNVPTPPNSRCPNSPPP